MIFTDIDLEIVMKFWTAHTQTHLVVKAGEVCVPPKNNPALICSLPDQDLINLQQREDNTNSHNHNQTNCWTCEKLSSTYLTCDKHDAYQLSHKTTY